MSYSDYINNKRQNNKSLNKANNIVIKRTKAFNKGKRFFVLSVGSSAIASGIEAATAVTDSTTITTHLVAGGLAIIAAASAGFAIKYNHDYKELAGEKQCFQKRK